MIIKTNTSDIMFIAEAPGSQEDEAGIPFVGRSGKLLDELPHSALYHLISELPGSMAPGLTGRIVR